MPGSKDATQGQWHEDHKIEAKSEPEEYAASFIRKNAGYVAGGTKGALSGIKPSMSLPGRGVDMMDDMLDQRLAATALTESITTQPVDHVRNPQLQHYRGIAVSTAA